MKEHLQRVGFKVAENRVRKMMNEVCRESDRKSGYLLKEIFLYTNDNTTSIITVATEGGLLPH